jgi:diguanylate cyclase (GGDEF)-like protein
VSFRSKLAAFFVLVVILPILAVGFVLLELLGDNETGKADARLATSQAVAVNLTRELGDRADAIAERVAGDLQVAAALRAGNEDALETRLLALRSATGATRIAIARRRVAVADTGGPTAVFPTFRPLVDGSGRSQGTLEVAVADAAQFARRVAGITGLAVAVSSAERVLASTVPGVRAAAIPARRGTVDAEGGAVFRAASYDAPSFDAQVSRVTVLEPTAVLTDEQEPGRALIFMLLAGFLVVALTLGWFVARSLHGQLGSFLYAARRIGQGDYAKRVPTVGRDDFALLGEEFNKMSAQLEARERELTIERERLRRALGRLGEAFASGLDRERTLEVALAAMCEGVAADAGRAWARGGPDRRMEVVVNSGDVASADAALAAVEARAFEVGVAARGVTHERAAIALPLRTPAGGLVGFVSIARPAGAFTDPERELLGYLGGQAAQSLENADLHELVERQAVEDGLTGLANRRRFEERLGEEAERARRFPGQALALVMLDIDDFKAVNDTLGHVAGDEVLRAVAGAVLEDRRETDVAARYGGEELALILPGADIDGGVRAAERIRGAVEQLDFGLPGPDGMPLRVTVSAGVAVFGLSAQDAAGLVAAADEALYEAKRAGKNRVLRSAGAAALSAE